MGLLEFFECRREREKKSLCLLQLSVGDGLWFVMMPRCYEQRSCCLIHNNSLLHNGRLDNLLYGVVFAAVLRNRFCLVVVQFAAALVV